MESSYKVWIGNRKFGKSIACGANQWLGINAFWQKKSLLGVILESSWWEEGLFILHPSASFFFFRHFGSDTHQLWYKKYQNLKCLLTIYPPDMNTYADYFMNSFIAWIKEETISRLILGKKILEQLWRTRFFTGFENP